MIISVRPFFKHSFKRSHPGIGPSTIFYIEFATSQHMNTFYQTFQHITLTLLAVYYERCQDRIELLRLFRSDRFSEFMRTATAAAQAMYLWRNFFAAIKENVAA
jgi:hypothetical protein